MTTVLSAVLLGAMAPPPRSSALRLRLGAEFSVLRRNRHVFLSREVEHKIVLLRLRGMTMEQIAIRLNCGPCGKLAVMVRIYNYADFVESWFARNTALSRATMAGR